MTISCCDDERDRILYLASKLVHSQKKISHDVVVVTPPVVRQVTGCYRNDRVVSVAVVPYNAACTLHSIMKSTKLHLKGESASADDDNKLQTKPVNRVRNALVTTTIRLRFDGSSTVIRRPCDCFGKIIKVTLTYLLAAVTLTINWLIELIDWFIYLFRPQCSSLVVT